MARNLLKRYNNVEEYNRVKCTLDIRQISLINTYKDTKYGVEYDTVTSVYKIRNKSNNINLFNNTTLVNSMISMKINGIEVEPTNEFQFDNYENSTIECEFCNITSIPSNVFSGCTFLTSIEIPNSVTSIGNSAFNKCSLLSSVIFEEGSKLQSIGNHVFYHCYSLSSIEIPNSVTSIGNYVFNNCYSLSEITIPNSVTSIGDSAFDECSSLRSIDIPNSVTSIGSSAFTGCYSLTSVTIPNSVTSIGDSAFTGCYLLTSVTIPDSVTSIGDSAFVFCNSLRSITIPNSVTSIGARAFDSCKSLTSIVIPNSVTSIENSSFITCFSLSEITIPSGVTSIGNYAFASCYPLNSITIPNSVTSIGSSAFYICSSLSEITCLATTAPAISSDTFRDICKNGVLYYPQGSDYSSWLSISNYYLGYYNWVRVELQDAYDFKVNFITNGVRVDSPYNSLVINGIEGIKQDDNSYLFIGLQPTDDCYEFDLIADGEVIDRVDIKHKNKWLLVGDNSSMLTCMYNTCQSTTIYSGNNLTYSGAYVDGVYVDTLSSSYTFNDVSEHIIQYSGVTSIRGTVFRSCSLLSSIDIPSGVTSIGNNAFYGCYSLSEINMPNSVISIGANAFRNCYSLSEITIPSGVTSIGNYAFTNCYSLSSIEILSDVMLIGTSAFTNCYSLTSIEIPNSVTSIGNGVFSDCRSLSSVTFEEGSKLQSIGNDAFNKCSLLSSIDIPSGVTSIGNYVFYYCYSLSEITIPNSVTSIGGNAFTNCYSLTSIEIPNSVTSIGDSAFNNCRSLSSVTFEEGSKLQSIGNDAFRNCYSLSEITIPSGVTSIGNYAFSGCTSLSEITCLATTAPTVSSNTFSNISSLGVLYYPGLNSSYDAWKEYLPNWDFISSYTPKECTNLVISAENVNCRATSTTISYTATTNGVYDGNVISGIELIGSTISEPFSQNTDTENEVIRTIIFEYLGATASTAITQDVWFDPYYEIDLNNQWQLSTSITNPDSDTYDGVYESFSNKGNNSKAAICTITINGYENFNLYIRSYGESCCDFVVVSNLDCTLSNSTTSGANVKMTTSGKTTSSTNITNYTLVEFSGIDGNEHTIQIMYRKDSSGASGTDQGYLLIPKEQ